jgi:hypothetical protein
MPIITTTSNYENLTAAALRTAALNAFNNGLRANRSRGRADIGNLSVVVSPRRISYWVNEIRVSRGAFEDHLAKHPVSPPFTIFSSSYLQLD